MLGQNKDDACRALRAQRLNCHLAVVTTPSDGSPGAVVRADPAPAAQVRAGTVVTLHHLGESSVPATIGQSVTQARAAITRAELRCTPRSRGPAPAGQPVDVVVTQDPAEGKAVPAGSSVTVEHYGAATVPDVRNLAVPDACNQLRNSGFVCQQEPLGDVPPGQQRDVVVDQTPVGVTAPPNSPVTVRFYDGRFQRTVPNVVSMPIAQAESTVRAAGLNPVLVPRDAPWKPGLAHGQNPAAAAIAIDGTNVEIYYEDTAPNELRRMRQDADGAIWVITTNPTYSPAGYVAAGTIGYAYAPDTPRNEWIKPIVSYQCHNCLGHSRTVHYYTDFDGDLSGFGFSKNGYSGWVFKDNYAPGQMAELHRLKRDDGQGKVDFAYGVPGSGEWDWYVSRGFVDDAPIGWIWTTP